MVSLFSFGFPKMFCSYCKLCLVKALVSRSCVMFLTLLAFVAFRFYHQVSEVEIENKNIKLKSETKSKTTSLEIATNKKET